MQSLVTIGSAGAKEALFASVGRHRLAEEEALHLVATEQAQQPRLLLGFDALRDHASA